MVTKARKKELAKDELVSKTLLFFDWFWAKRTIVIPIIIVIIIFIVIGFWQNKRKEMKELMAVQILRQAKTIEQVVAFNDNYADTYTFVLGIKRLAELYIKDENWSEALKNLDRFIDLSDGHPLVLFVELEKAYVLEQMNNIKDLDLCYEKLISKYKLSTNYATVLISFAESLYRRRQWQRSRQQYLKLQELNDTTWVSLVDKRLAQIKSKLQ